MKKNEIIQTGKISMLVFGIALLLKIQKLIPFKLCERFGDPKNVNTHVQNLFEKGRNISKEKHWLQKNAGINQNMLTSANILHSQ